MARYGDGFLQICFTYFQELYNLRRHDKVLKAIFIGRHKTLKGLTSLILLFDTTKEKVAFDIFNVTSFEG